MKNRFVHPTIRYIVFNTIVVFTFIIILRGIFYLKFIDFTDIASNDITTSVSLGIRFDIKLALLCVFPMMLIVIIFNQLFFTKKFFRIFSYSYFLILYICLAIFHLTDFGHFDYLDCRLDASILRFFSNPEISFQMVFESYPVVKGFIGLLFFSILIFWFQKKTFTFYKSKIRSFRSKKNKAFSLIVMLLIFSLGIYGSLNHYPLRWSQAFFSKNHKLNQSSLNPVLYFFDSFKFRNVKEDKLATKEYFPVVANYLGVSSDSINFMRYRKFNDSIKTKPNIVIVMMESLGVASMGYYGNTANATPYIDSLLNKSIHFDNFYVHKPGTAGSVFASITGLPDVDDVKTVSRNPRAIDQRIIFDQFKGYDKYYFLGGSANWANIRGVFQSNIDGLKIYEEGSYKMENRADVWGIDDYDLFQQVSNILESNNTKPFIAYIQTSSNHRPFSVPDKKGTYSPIQEIDKELLKNSGFKSIEQLNALRYLDFNVKTFMKKVKKSPFYDNTIFVFFGDHSTVMNPTKAQKKEFDLNIYLHHVPLFIFKPNENKPVGIKNFAKLADLFPTIAEVAKQDYVNYTLGSNALDTTNLNSFAFLHHKIDGEPAVGLLQKEFYFTKTNFSGKTHLYKLSDEKTTDVSIKYNKVAESMDSLLTSYYHSTKYLYFNNKKD